MKKIFIQSKISLVGAAALLWISSCAPSLDAVKPSAGEVDFSKYIAIGNSLTAGFADGGLYLEGQKVAYPNLIAEQLRLVGAGAFNAPFFREDQLNGSGYLRLKSLVNGQPVMENVIEKLAIRGQNPNGKPLYTKYTEEIHNYGVPGMRMDMAFKEGIGTIMGNPFFERLLPDNTPQTYTYFEHATKNNHTFFSFWLGNNDALGYATNGAVENPEDPTTHLTSADAFRKFYTDFITALTSKEQKGVVATIPDVTSVPYFTTVTRKALIEGVNAKLPEDNKIKDLYIESAKGKRAATDEDLFVLPFSSAGLLGSTTPSNPYPYGLHPNNPIASRFVLDPDEVIIVKARVKEFNDIIKEVATSKKLAIADAHDFLNKVKSPGVKYNNIDITADFIKGNAFSLDGIHLTPMGNAMIANLFIDAINAQYKSSVSKVDASKYRGVIYP